MRNYKKIGIVLRACNALLTLEETIDFIKV